MREVWERLIRNKTADGAASNGHAEARAPSNLEGSFSQLPVCDGSEFAGLLTAETIARWLATQLIEDGAHVKDAPVWEGS